MNKQTKKLSRRTTAIAWLGGIAIIVGLLIYLEQIPILYVLATISLVVLLIVVAFSDLEKVGVEAFSNDRN
ncbi:MAG: hypothetical protein IPM25_01790 [Chloracidobacterium sp.]|nr:hypothetical protein [Chloracidobacterium sp.]